jgi:glucose-6-phosphate isomerase
MGLFEGYKSFKRLEELSKNLVDLSNKNILTPSRIKNFKRENCGFKLLFGCERIDEEVLNELFNLAKESFCLDKMRDMQFGKVVNFIENQKSENRAVLHTALRDFFEDRIEEKKAFEASSLVKREVEKLKNFLKRVENFESVIQIGIGGSILGVQAIYHGLKNLLKKEKKVFFVSNVDPDNVLSVLKRVNLSKTLIISVSKSGTTLETLTNEEFIRDEMIKKGLNPKEHIVSVTSEKSKMDDKAKYLEVFHIWDYIGGRFSATSMVGGVLLSFALGFENYIEILKGANKMDKVALKDFNNNLPLISALLGIWNRNFLKYQTSCIIPYSHPLFYFCMHLQQCFMESNGKTIDKKGERINFETSPIIWGDVGTNAQHSFFQFLHQGSDIVPIEFIGFLESQLGDKLVKKTTSNQKLLSNLLAQSIALAMGKKDENLNKNFEGNRPSSILMGKKLTPFSLGALLSYFENKVAFQGFIWNINSFDQEGVQLGKTLAKKMMDLFSKEGGDFILGKSFLDEIFL